MWVGRGVARAAQCRMAATWRHPAAIGTMETGAGGREGGGIYAELSATSRVIRHQSDDISLFGAPFDETRELFSQYKIH